VKCGICLHDVEPVTGPGGGLVCPRDGEATWLDTPAEPAAPKRTTKTKAAKDAAPTEGT
jgi:hypothetical protein